MQPVLDEERKQQKRKKHKKQPSLSKKIYLNENNDDDEVSHQSSHPQSAASHTPQKPIEELIPKKSVMEDMESPLVINNNKPKGKKPHLEVRVNSVAEY